MRLPRDLSGDALIKKLKRLGYAPTRTTGSHVRLTRTSGSGEHHITIPKHVALRVGTLNGILTEVADQLEISKDELLLRIL